MTLLIPPTPPYAIEYGGPWVWWFKIMTKTSKAIKALTDAVIEIDNGANQTFSGYGSNLVATVTISVSPDYPTATVILFGEATIQTSEVSTYYDLKLKRNGEDIKYIDWYGGMPQLPHLKLFAGDAPGAGVHVYDLYVSDYYGFGSYDVNNPTLLGMRFGETL